MKISKMTLNTFPRPNEQYISHDNDNCEKYSDANYLKINCVNKQTI